MAPCSLELSLSDRLRAWFKIFAKSAIYFRKFASKNLKKTRKNETKAPFVVKSKQFWSKEKVFGNP